jgi:hypothetical protein
MLAGLLSIAAGFVIKAILTSSLPRISILPHLRRGRADLHVKPSLSATSTTGTTYPSRCRSKAPCANTYRFSADLEKRREDSQVVIARAIYSLSLMAATLIVLFAQPSFT